MTSESYDDKRHDLEAQSPVFSTFAASAGLISVALIIVQLVL